VGSSHASITAPDGDFDRSSNVSEKAFPQIRAPE